MSFSKPELRLTDQAADDILFILTHTSKTWSREQSRRYRRLLEEALKRILDFPMIGTIDNSARPAIRQRAIEHHVVFYEILDSGIILILRILHERMDLSRWESIEWINE